MLKTNLKYYDYIASKVYNAYIDKAGYYYIRRGNEYEYVDKEDLFDPTKGPKLNRTNLIRYLRKQIKTYQEVKDTYKNRQDNWNMNRAIGRVSGLESVLEYVLKMQEE